MQSKNLRIGFSPATSEASERGHEGIRACIKGCVASKSAGNVYDKAAKIEQQIHFDANRRVKKADERGRKMGPFI